MTTQTYEQVLNTVFPDDTARKVFQFNLEQLLTGNINSWYWYGAGNNGKTILMKMLEKSLASSNITVIHEADNNPYGDEIHRVNNSVIYISNMEPTPTPGQIVTKFEQVF